MSTDKTIAGKLTVTTPSDLEARIQRVFDAPRTMVFDAHTKPELVKRWLFGPDGWSLETCEIDLRVGGRMRYEMHRDGGAKKMGWSGVFLEIVPPERIVHTELFDEDWTGGETRITILFHELPGGRTELDMTVRYSSKEARDGALATGMTDGMEMGYARLDGIFAAARDDRAR